MTTRAPSRSDRLRVVMLLPRLPVAGDWLRAARMVAEVTSVDTHPSRFWTEIRVSNGILERVLRVPKFRPSRYFSTLNAWTHGLAIVILLRALRPAAEPNLFHCHFGSAMGVTSQAARRLGVPFIVSEHSSAITGLNPDNQPSARGLRAAKNGYRRACAVLPVSNSLASALRTRELADPGRCVPNPVDTDLFHPGLDHPTKHVIAVARLEPVKRLDLLIDAFAMVLTQEPDARLSIAGSGSSEHDLRRRVRELGISGSVGFLGPLTRRGVATLLRSGSVFAVTSFTENLPVAALEAAASGLPIVATDVGGMREIIRNTCGEVVSLPEATPISECLLRWLSPTDADREAAREGAVNNYSLTTVSESLDSVYRQCASGRPPVDAV